MRLSRHPSLERDVLEIRLYLDEVDPIAAQRVSVSIERAIRKIHQTPEIGTLYAVRNPKLRGIRLLPVSEYQNYLIFYAIPSGDEVRILYVFHGVCDISRIMIDDPRI